MYAVIVIVYLAVIQGGGFLMKHLSGENDFRSTRAVFYGMIIPLGAALIFTYGALRSSVVFGAVHLANGDQTLYPGTLLPVLVNPVLFVILLVERHAVEPALEQK